MYFWLVFSISVLKTIKIVLELDQPVGNLAPVLAPEVDKLASSKLELLEIKTSFVN
jgi:hypothetical protein